MNIFKLCAAILQDFGHPKNRCWHTQLNVCEKEGFPCFLYLIQIFALKYNDDPSLEFDFLTAVSKTMTPCKNKRSQKKCKKCNAKKCKKSKSCKKNCKKTCDLCKDGTNFKTKSNYRNLYFS